MMWCGLVVALVIATEVTGQQDRRSGGSDPSRATSAMPLGEILKCDAVLKELKVSKEQQEKLTGLTRDIDYREFGRLSADQLDKMLEQLESTRGTRQLQDDSIAKVLDEGQWKRLKQIHLQSMVASGAFAEPEIAKALGLNEEQIKQMRSKEYEMIRETETKSRNTTRSSSASRQDAAIRLKKFETEFLGVLTRPQKAEWKKLTGKTFDVTQIGQQQRRTANNSPNKAENKPGAKEGKRATTAGTAKKQKEAEYRIWTSTVGTQIEAKYTSRIVDTIKLTKRNGETIKVRVDQLSEADQKYIDERQKRKK